MSWAEIMMAVNSNISKPLNELINELIGGSNPTEAGTNNLFEFLKKIEDIQNLGVIKSVQRGSVSFYVNDASRSVTIKAVDTGKSFVIAGDGANVCRANLSNSTTLNLVGISSGSHTWQVIEFR